MPRVLPRLWNEDTDSRDKRGVRLAAYALLAFLLTAVGLRVIVHFT